MTDYVATVLSPKRAQEGTFYHTALRSGREAGYTAEVPVEYVYTGREVELCLGGRIDGLIAREEGYLLEEVKTTYRAQSSLGEGGEVHWAQAKAYGAIFALERGLESIAIRLVYVLLPGGEQYPMERTFDAAQLHAWLDSLCEGFLQGAEREYLRRRAALESILHMDFPYEKTRAGQELMMEAVLEHARSGGQIYVEAPTGIGKTIAALYPALKALGEEACQKVFYCTARTTIRAVAAQTFTHLLSRGLKARCVVLWAKESLCPNPAGQTCHPALCPRAQGFYTRLGQAMAALAPSGCFSREYLLALADEYMLCPHELALAVADASEVVVCDYNHAFDPRARIQRYFAKGGDYLLLIDEAHNLVDRARDMFTCRLGEGDVQALKRKLPAAKESAPADKRLRRHLNGMLKALRQVRKPMEEEGCEAQVLQSLAEDCQDALEALQSALMDCIMRDERRFGETLMELFFACRSFSMLLEGFDATSALVAYLNGRAVELEIQCLDPALRLAAVYGVVGAVVLFSATLQPFSYYERLLGSCGNASTLSIPPPFDPANRRIIHIPTDTTYARRGETAQAVVRALKAMVEAREGNYFAFFPSYAYMRLVHGLFTGACQKVYAPMQSANMALEDREEFLARFDETHPRGMVAFAVLGGIFGEGIDLKMEKLIGVAVVGVGLPGLSFSRELIKRYHDCLGEEGFAFAYAIPAINRVRQAAGRLIRTAEDRGVILLVDRRYTYPRYYDLLPEGWKPLESAPGLNSFKSILTHFWTPR